MIFILAILFLVQLSSLNRLRQNRDARYSIYRAAGNWLAENTPHDASVGALEVGIIGFFAQRPMIDFAGLIQPEVAGRFNYGSTYEDAAVWAVKEFRPDYLVLFADAFPSLDQEYVAESCKLVSGFQRKDVILSTPLIIYDCRQ